MRRAFLVSASVAFAMLASTSHVMLRAQQKPPVSAVTPTSNRGEEMENVGPNRWRVKPADTPYDHWFERARTRMPAFEGLVIQDVRTVPLKPWADQGVNGLYVKMADYQIVDGWILEIPPKGSTKPQRHMFEAGLYFFGGPGHTMIQQEGRQPQRVDWGYRTLFSIPLNVRYQHFNDSDKPVRLVAVTSFPFVMNSTDSEKFVYENPFRFTDRYDAQEDYLKKSNKLRTREIETNVVKDALDYKLEEWNERGEGSTSMGWQMAGNSQIDMHVSEMPSKLYKRAHRHSSDAFILLLSGHGYSITWPEGQYDKRVRVDWQEGTMFVPPIYWYHQHLNPGDESARYLAINAPVIVRNLGLRFQDQLEPDLPEIEAEFKAEVETAARKPKQ
jgi:gentisate 1,2-dioxygenase